MAKGFYYLANQKANLFYDIIELARKLSSQRAFNALLVPSVGFEKDFHMVGEQSDLILKKELFYLQSRKNDTQHKLVLRPEFTALIVKYYKDNITGPVRYFSHGSLFRYEKPQAGRQREFNQINWEIIGENGYTALLDLFYILLELLKHFDLKVTIQLNYLPDISFVQILKEYFTTYYDSLSDISKTRFNNNNYLRILDSKDPEDQNIIQNAPKITIPDDEQANINKIIQLIESYNQTAILNHRLVRGLDYYYGLVWEIVDNSKIDKRQNAIGGGGMYKIHTTTHEVPAIGMAIGVERWMNIINSNFKKTTKIGQLCCLELTFNITNCSFVKLDNNINKHSLKLAKLHKCDYMLTNKNNNIILEKLSNYDKFIVGNITNINLENIINNIIGII